MQFWHQVTYLSSPQMKPPSILRHEFCTFSAKQPQGEGYPRVLVCECTASTKHECAGTLCLHEWGLHVLVRGHVRHVGVGIVSLEKTELEEMKQRIYEWHKSLPWCPSTTISFTIIRHTCFIKMNSWLCMYQ